MDYEKKYNEAIKRAKQHCADYVVETIFPELKESGDKKPNGAIVMEDFNEGNGFYKINLAYLNKEQVEEIEGLVKKWIPESKESEGEKIRKELIKYFKKYQALSLGDYNVQDILAWLNSLKDRVQSKQEWDKDDDKHCDRILKELREQKQKPVNTPYIELIDSDIDWLKSLKDRYTWKPSERQKESLLWCVVHLGGADKQTLGELLEELNKL